jgi:hypothetical protein
MYGKPVVIKNDDFFTSDEISSKVKAKQVITSFMFSNELFYAHFSMYGVLKHNVKPNYLISFKYLATSIIPRSIYPNRPDDVYTYYVKSVQAKPGQIYTIHHATAWYLNLGYFGIILGAFILALIFLGGYLINWVTFKSKNKFLLLGAELGLILICAQMVTFITAGPEAYKALIIEGFILPILIFSALINTKNEKRIN